MPIIPNCKQGGGGGSGDVNVNIQGVNDHEKLGSLYGGDADGHWHLTRSEYEKLKRLLEVDIPTPPVPDTGDYDGGYPWTTDDEYDENADRWLDGGPAQDMSRPDYDGGIVLSSLHEGTTPSGDNLDGGEI